MKGFSNLSSVMVIGATVSCAAFLLTSPLQASQMQRRSTSNRNYTAARNYTAPRNSATNNVTTTPNGAVEEGSVVVMKDYSGTVVEVKELPPEGEIYSGAEVIMRIGKNDMVVYLGPAEYMEKQGIKLQKGDKLSVLGAMVKQGKQYVIIGHEVTKNGKMMKLRDEDGKSLWAAPRNGR